MLGNKINTLKDLEGHWALDFYAWERCFDLCGGFYWLTILLFPLEFFKSSVTWKRGHKLQTT